MNLQYLTDKYGNNTGVYIPISDWEIIKEKLKDINFDKNIDLHQWQKDIIDERLDKIAKGNEKFHDFEIAIDEIEKEL